MNQTRHWLAVTRAVARNFIDHRVPGRAAEMSFYFFLSVFPILLIGMATLGLVLDAQWLVRESINERLADIVPAPTLRLVERLLNDLSTRPARPFGVGIVVAVWAASSGMVATIRALNSAYRVEEERAWWRRRLVGMALTLLFMVLTVAAMTLVTYGSSIAEVLEARMGLGAGFVMIWRIAQWPLIIVFLLLAFNFLYRYAPHRKTAKHRWFEGGTLAGIAFWLAASLAFKYYVARLSSFDVAYGSLGAVIVALLWFQLMSVAVLTGAEVNAELESHDANAEPSRR